MDNQPQNAFQGKPIYEVRFKKKGSEDPFDLDEGPTVPGMKMQQTVFYVAANSFAEAEARMKNLIPDTHVIAYISIQDREMFLID